MAFTKQRALGHILDVKGSLVMIVPNTKGRLIYEEFSEPGKPGRGSNFFEVQSARLYFSETDPEGCCGKVEIDLNVESEVIKMVEKSSH